MKLNFVTYLIFLLFLEGCGNQELIIRDYGSPKNENDSLKVFLDLRKIKNYGILVDRIHEIVCNDSIPKIVIEKNHVIRNIHPIEECYPRIIDPKGKHYVSFEKGKPYQNHFLKKEIRIDSLNWVLLNDFSKSDESENPEIFLIVIEASRNENVDGIEKFLTDVTMEFDKLMTILELNIVFWEVVPHLTPPPAMENEKQFH